jgi:hypothetical protein
MAQVRTRNDIIPNDRFQVVKKRAGKATGGGLMKFLRTAPKLAPEPEDTLRSRESKSPPKQSLDGAPSGFQRITRYSPAQCIGTRSG